MCGICQPVCVLVVLLMTIAQGVSWEELTNGQGNQDDDFLTEYPLAMPYDGSEEADVLSPLSEVKGKREDEKHDDVVSMKVLDSSHPEVKDQRSKDQGHPKVKGDKGNGQRKNVQKGRKTDDLFEANLNTVGEESNPVRGYVDLRPGSLDSDPEIDADTLEEDRDEDLELDPDSTTDRPEVEGVSTTESDGKPVAKQEEEDVSSSPSPTKFQRPLDLSLVEVYGDNGDDARGKEIDCTDGRFMDSIDCLLSSPADANLSKEGLKARQQLFDFMELSRQKRQSQTDDDDSSEFDEGSGTGNIYPDSALVTGGEYVLEQTIAFNLGDLAGLDLAAAEQQLEQQLQEAFSGVNGLLQVNVTELRTTEDGLLVAVYEVLISGQSVSGFGINEQQIVDSLSAELTNVTTPLYDLITIEGQNPLSPFDPSGFAESVGELLNDICNSTNPCPDNFAQCNSTGLDEGECLHVCFILELDGPCQHGGTCELTEDGTPVCTCTNNWTGDRCQDRVRSGRGLDDGEIAGATIGAVLVVIGVIGGCCWFLVCRKGTRNIHMTHYADDAGGSDKYSNPSSKISTFVIDRPRISTSPFNAFNPGHSSSPYQATVRSKPTLFSDA